MTEKTEAEAEITFLSLGWGVQSWTLAAMIALGELPGVELAIHADTGHEAAGTYEHAHRWTPWLEERGLRVVTVHPQLKDAVKFNRDDSASIYIPAHTLSREDTTNREGQLNRQCTQYWKIRPIRTHLRSLLPKRPRQDAVDCWQGISLDEFTRMRTSDVGYIRNVYPLVDLRMTRMDCVQWLQNRGLEVPPKSACVFCPYHSAKNWRDLKEQGGADWEKATEVDQRIRDKRPGFRSYVHGARLPLAEAVRIPQDQGGRQLEMEIPCDGGTCFV